MTRGHLGSLLLRCRALSSPSPCRFIPAHTTTTAPTGHSCFVRQTRSPGRPFLAGTTDASYVEATSSAVCFTSTGELHERLYAPHTHHLGVTYQLPQRR